MSVRDLTAHYRLESFNVATEQARTSSARVDQFIEGASQLLDAIGVLALADPKLSLENNGQLRQLKAKLPSYINSLQVVAPNGNVKSAAGEPGVPILPYSVADRKYFKEALAKNPLGFGEPAISRLNGKLSLALARPVLNKNGEVDCIVTLSISIENFQEILLNQKISPNSEITLLDENGVVVARAPEPNKWVAQTLLDRPMIQTMFRENQGQMEAPSIDGIDRLISYTKTSRAPWLIYVGVPTATALAPAQASLQRLWWLAALTGLAALVLATWISRRIANPIRQLSEDVRRFARGDLAHRTSINATGEVARLARDFNQMAETLQTNTDELRASEMRYDLALDATTDGLWEIDLINDRISGSPKLKGLLGYANSDLPDKRDAFEVLLHPDDKQRAIDALNNHIKFNHVLADEFRLRGKDGTYHWISRRGKSVRNEHGKVMRIVGSISNVTARKNAELEVMQLNAELEQRVQQRTADLTREIEHHQATQKQLKKSNIELQASLERLRQQTREMALLHEMSELLQAASTAEEYNKIISHAMQQLFNAKSGALYSLRSSRDLVEASITWGRFEQAETVFRPDDCWALKLSKLHFVARREDDVGCTHVASNDVLSYVCVPLNSHGESLGFIHLRAMTEAARDLLEAKLPLIHTVAEYLGLALGNFRLQQTLRHQSVRDGLTGLFNRRYLEESISREVARVSRDGTQLGIIMFDLDHFKRVNDTYGHDMGDAVLSHLGKLILAHVRDEDIPCRYGGEEFTVILPGANLESSRERAEELKRLISSMTVQWNGQIIGNINVSLGVACYPIHGTTWQQALKAADKALYAAKHAGRKQVVVAPI
jgi:diguanylate cyclase (GGDEF)-like protein/PAS domain S-box-containing protein